MSEIHRWHVMEDGSGMLERHITGLWVAYDDHAAAVAALEAELADYLEVEVRSDSIPCTEGWLMCHPLTEGDNAAIRLVELGRWEQHPTDENLYRPKEQRDER